MPSVPRARHSWGSPNCSSPFSILHPPSSLYSSLASWPRGVVLFSVPPCLCGTLAFRFAGGSGGFGGLLAQEDEDVGRVEGHDDGGGAALAAQFQVAAARAVSPGDAVGFGQRDLEV